MIIVINVITFIVIGIIIYNLIELISIVNVNKKINVKNLKLYNKVSENLVLLAKNKLIPKKLKWLNSTLVIGFMIIIFILALIFFYSYIKVFSTACILAIPFLISPIIIFKIILNKEKADILKVLPMYIINLKNHVSEDNNIIKAIGLVFAEEPLSKYLLEFKSKISRGVNVIEAFEALKQSVNVKSFSLLIDACQTCYISGGDFSKVLEQYLNIVTKENIHKESTKEKAYSDVLTLIAMIILNMFVIVAFVFANKEYASIIRGTVIGKVILNINALSYILIACFISRIYKEE